MLRDLVVRKDETGYHDHEVSTGNGTHLASFKQLEDAQMFAASAHMFDALKAVSDYFTFETQRSKYDKAKVYSLVEEALAQVGKKV